MRPRKRRAFAATIIVMLIGAVLDLDVRPTSAAVTQYITPETVLARVYGPTLVDRALYASCRLDAGYGKTAFKLRCGVDRIDQHWWGVDSMHTMWQNTTYTVVPHQQVIIGTHAGFRCEHGKKYGGWASGESTGFLNVARSDAHTRFRTYC